MKITKSHLQKIIKEELRLLEANPYDVEDKPPGQDPITPDMRIEKMEDEETNDAGDAYWVMVDDLVTSIGRQMASRVNGTEDEVFIKTGPGNEGITVKVTRRGK